MNLYAKPFIPKIYSEISFFEELTRNKVLIVEPIMDKYTIVKINTLNNKSTIYNNNKIYNLSMIITSDSLYRLKKNKLFFTKKYTISYDSKSDKIHVYHFDTIF